MKRISQADLKAMYAPMPEDFAVRALSALPHGEEKIYVKKKISVGFVLAAVLTLLAVGGVAAALNWDAVRFLYGREEPQMVSLTTPVNQKDEAGGVTLEITNAVTDGRVLAFDWTMQVDESVLPVYLQVDKVIIDDRDQTYFYYLESGQGLNRGWINKGGETVRSGELLKLWYLSEGESIHVELTVGVYKPKREVVLFSSPEDQEEAQALQEQGVWAVAPVSEEPSMNRWDDAHYTLWRYSPLSEDELVDYDRSEITLTFDVQVPENIEQRLVPEQDIYELPGGVTFRITYAYRTPLSLFAEVDMVVEGAKTKAEAVLKSSDYSFGFTDARGEYLLGQNITAGLWPVGFYWEDEVVHITQEVWAEAYDDAAIAEDDYLRLTYSRVREWQDGVAIQFEPIGEVRLLPEE